MTEAVIVSTARSPIGRAFKGSLKDERPDDLATAMVQAALAKVPGFDPGAEDGRAIVSLGNPDQAGQVLTYVPGMGSNLGTVTDQLDRMDAVLARAPQHTAAIVWLGYDAPDLGPEVAFGSFAREGAEPLHRFQEGLRATHLGDAPSTNVLLAHSYGTTTYGITAAEHGVSADKVYLLGSIGTDQESAHRLLGTPTAEVYATTHGWDVAHLPPAVDYYRASPADPLFEAHLLPGDYRGIIHSHTEYLHQPDILDNIAGLLARRRP